MWRTENFSAARVIRAPYGLAYHKYVTRTAQKNHPKGVHVIYILPPLGDVVSVGGLYKI